VALALKGVGWVASHARTAEIERSGLRPLTLHHLWADSDRQRDLRHPAGAAGDDEIRVVGPCERATSRSGDWQRDTLEKLRFVYRLTSPPPVKGNPQAPLSIDGHPVGAAAPLSICTTDRRLIDPVATSKSKTSIDAATMK
jgi:hypothetical protein